MMIFVVMTVVSQRSAIGRAVVCSLVIAVCSPAIARYPRVLKNLGLQSGPLWRSGAPGPVMGWEIGFDHYVRTCIVHKRYWGVGFGRQEGLGDRSAIWSLRFSVSPYHLSISRRWRFNALTSVRLSHWTTPFGSTDCLRPEVGFQVMRLNDLWSPKLAVCYGREWRIGGAVERSVAPGSSDVLSMQLGLSFNFGALSYRKFIKRRKAHGVGS